MPLPAQSQTRRAKAVCLKEAERHVALTGRRPAGSFCRDGDGVPPITARKTADDSYRVTRRWDSVRSRRRAAFCCPVNQKGNDMDFPGVGFLIVFFGGGIGAALRHGVNLVTARLL